MTRLLKELNFTFILLRWWGTSNLHVLVSGGTYKYFHQLLGFKNIKGDVSEER